MSGSINIVGNDGLFPPAGQQIDCGVQLVHLVSGEDIIGHVFVDTNDKSVIVEGAVIPQVTSPDGKRFSVGLMPFRPYINNDRLTLAPQHVMLLADVNEQMRNLYAQFTSSIVVASPGDIVV